MCVCVCVCVSWRKVSPLSPFLSSFPSQSCFLETPSSMRRTVFRYSITTPLLPSTVGPCSGCSRGRGYIRLHAMVPVLQAKCGDRPTLKKKNNSNHNHMLSSK